MAKEVPLVIGRRGYEDASDTLAIFTQLVADLNAVLTFATDLKAAIAASDASADIKAKVAAVDLPVVGTTIES
ncbi:MAG TPA: hypothetical protein PLI86_00025 [bacterium]|jgi:hypothetical protein|nr:hypothetical protein [bacterium]